MKILIVDNETTLRNILKTILAQLSTEYIIDEAIGVGDGLKKINSFAPDVVLLDVEMDDGTGFELMQQIPAPKFQLIFTTAHQHYALKAFKFSAIDYLLKPIDPTELQQALQKAQQQLTQNTLQQQLQVLQQQLQQKNKQQQIILKEASKTYCINVNDILYCKADGAYTKFFLKNSVTIYQSHNLRYYEEILEEFNFIRTHHSCLVNVEHIKIFDRKTEGGIVVLEDGHTVPVSQRKKDIIIELLEK